MFKAILTASAVILGITAMPPPVQAQTICMKRDALVSQLNRQYGELRRATGLGSAQALIEVWVSYDTGSWTILLTRPNGTSCIMAAGDAWQDGIEQAMNDHPA